MWCRRKVKMSHRGKLGMSLSPLSARALEVATDDGERPEVHNHGALRVERASSHQRAETDGYQHGVVAVAVVGGHGDARRGWW